MAAPVLWTTFVRSRSCLGLAVCCGRPAQLPVSCSQLLVLSSVDCLLHNPPGCYQCRFETPASWSWFRWARRDCTAATERQFESKVCTRHSKNHVTALSWHGHVLCSRTIWLLLYLQSLTCYWQALNSHRVLFTMRTCCVGCMYTSLQ